MRTKIVNIPSRAHRPKFPARKRHHSNGEAQVAALCGMPSRTQVTGSVNASAFVNKRTQAPFRSACARGSVRIRDLAAFPCRPPSRRLPRPPCALCQIMLIESLPDQRLDNSLAAHVQVLSRLVEFLKHSRCDVHVHALNRLNHAAWAFEKMRNFLALIGQPRD